MVNGSYKVRIPIANKNHSTNFSTGAYSVFRGDYAPEETALVNVNMLSQIDYAHGWQQVVPKKRFFIKNHDTLGTNVYRMKVNLAQLPYHLWHRMHKYSRYSDSHIVNDGMYQYIVEPSCMDNVIRELVSLFPYDKQHVKRVSELLTMLKDNDIYGWIVIKAHELYK